MLCYLFVGVLKSVQEVCKITSSLLFCRHFVAQEFKRYSLPFSFIIRLCCCLETCWVNIRFFEQRTILQLFMDSCCMATVWHPCYSCYGNCYGNFIQYPCWAFCLNLIIYLEGGFVLYPICEDQLGTDVFIVVFSSIELMIKIEPVTTMSKKCMGSYIPNRMVFVHFFTIPKNIVTCSWYCSRNVIVLRVCRAFFSFKGLYIQYILLMKRKG